MCASGTALLVAEYEAGRARVLVRPWVVAEQAAQRFDGAVPLERTDASGWVSGSALRPIASTAPDPAEVRRTLALDARRMIGVPYRWGGASGNGIDCSGLVRLLHRWVGVSIPRDAYLQHGAARRVEAPYASGDLLFFGPRPDQRAPAGPRIVTHVAR